MEPIWNSTETRDLVMALYGKQQWFHLAAPSVRSFKDRADYVRYHYHEVNDLLTEYIATNLGSRSVFHLHADQEQYEEFSDMMMRIRAHVTACIQSLHAMPDICAHMLHYSLALDRQPDAPKPRGITATSVHRLMGRHPELVMLCKLFSDLFSGPGFACLDALSNTAKHRSIVRPSLTEDLTGKKPERFTLPFESFTYEGLSFSSMDVREFLRDEHDRMQQLMVDIGVELNSVLKRRSAANAPTPAGSP